MQTNPATTTKNAPAIPATGDPSERRQHARFPESFAFWFQRPESDEPDAAFMLNISAGGAAFLAASDVVPKIGDRIRLSEMFSTDRAIQDQALRLPLAARVLRVDDPNARVRRVAIQFETPVLSKLRRIRPEKRSAADRGVGTWTQTAEPNLEALPASRPQRIRQPVEPVH